MPNDHITVNDALEEDEKQKQNEGVIDDSNLSFRVAFVTPQKNNVHLKTSEYRLVTETKIEVSPFFSFFSLASFKVLFFMCYHHLTSSNSIYLFSYSIS